MTPSSAFDVIFVGAGHHHLISASVCLLDRRPIAAKPYTAPSESFMDDPEDFRKRSRPLLQAIARDDDLVDVINDKVLRIQAGGAHLDEDTRGILREIFPKAKVRNIYGSISKTMFLPNNLERDTAIRVLGPDGQVGDSVSEVKPVETFGGEVLIEGVY